MTIFVGFFPKQSTTYDQYVIDKLKASYEAIKYFQNGLFTSQTAELWFDAPSEALGGESLSEPLPAGYPYNAFSILESRLKSLSFYDLRRTVIILRGMWSIGNVELAGYFSLHNPKDWRKTYGDLEISAYGNGEINDIVDAIWLRNDAVEVISEFVKSMNRNLSNLKVGVNQVVFCKGLWNKLEPENLRVIYMVNEMRGLLKLFYDARRKEKKWDMEKIAKPLDTTFLLNTLEETSIVKERFSRELEQDATVPIPVGSKLYIGKEPDSFKKLYADVTEAIIKPALSKLPNDVNVKEQIEKGLRDYPEK